MNANVVWSLYARFLNGKLAARIRYEVRANVDELFVANSCQKEESPYPRPLPILGVS
jgi:hypothetical protein